MMNMRGWPRRILYIRQMCRYMEGVRLSRGGEDGADREGMKGRTAEEETATLLREFGIEGRKAQFLYFENSAQLRRSVRGP